VTSLIAPMNVSDESKATKHEAGDLRQPIGCESDIAALQESKFGRHRGIQFRLSVIQVSKSAAGKMCQLE